MLCSFQLTLIMLFYIEGKRAAGKWGGSKLRLLNSTKSRNIYNNGGRWKSIDWVENWDGVDMIMIHEQGKHIYKLSENSVSTYFTASGSVVMQQIVHVNNLVDGSQVRVLVATEDCLYSMGSRLDAGIATKLMGNCDPALNSIPATHRHFDEINGGIAAFYGGEWSTIISFAYSEQSIYIKFANKENFLHINTMEVSISEVMMPMTKYYNDPLPNNDPVMAVRFLEVADGFLYFYSFYKSLHMFGKVKLGLKERPKEYFRLIAYAATSPTTYSNKPEFSTYNLPEHDNWDVVGFKHWRYHVILVLLQHKTESISKVVGLEVDRAILYQMCNPVEDCTYTNTNLQNANGRLNLLAIAPPRGHQPLEILWQTNEGDQYWSIQRVSVQYRITFGPFMELEFTGVRAGVVRSKYFQENWPLARHYSQSIFKVCREKSICWTFRPSFKNVWGEKSTGEILSFDTLIYIGDATMPFLYTSLHHYGKYKAFSTGTRNTPINPQKLRLFGVPFGFGAEKYLYFSQNPELNSKPVERFVFRCFNGTRCPVVSVREADARFPGPPGGSWQTISLDKPSRMSTGADSITAAILKYQRNYRVDMLKKGLMEYVTYKFKVTVIGAGYEETYVFANQGGRYKTVQTMIEPVMLRMTIRSANLTLEAPDKFHIHFINHHLAVRVRKCNPIFEITGNEELETFELEQIFPAVDENNPDQKRCSGKFPQEVLSNLTDSNATATVLFFTEMYQLTQTLNVTDTAILNAEASQTTVWFKTSPEVLTNFTHSIRTEANNSSLSANSDSSKSLQTPSTLTVLALIMVADV